MSGETLERLNATGREGFEGIRRVLSKGRALEFFHAQESDLVLSDIMWSTFLGIMQFEENKKRVTGKDHVLSTLNAAASLIVQSVVPQSGKTGDPEGGSVNFNLTDEQKAIRETVRKFAQAEVAPRAEELDRTGEFPYDLVKRCAEIGVQGLIFPEEVGGTNADIPSWALAIEELARGDASLAVTIFVGAGAGAVIQQKGTPEMIRNWVGPIIKGEGIGSFAITEPDAGSDNRSIRTTAEIQGDRIVVNGVKSFITNPGTRISKFVNTVCALKSDVDNPRDQPFLHRGGSDRNPRVYGFG